MRLCRAAGAEIAYIYTSGHASPADLRALAATVRPKMEAVAIRVRDLYATPADLLGAAVNSETEAHARNLRFLASPTGRTEEKAESFLSRCRCSFQPR